MILQSGDSALVRPDIPPKFSDDVCLHRERRKSSCGKRGVTFAPEKDSDGGDHHDDDHNPW